MKGTLLDEPKLLKVSVDQLHERSNQIIVLSGLVNSPSWDSDFYHAHPLNTKQANYDWKFTHLITTLLDTVGNSKL